MVVKKILHEGFVRNILLFELQIYRDRLRRLLGLNQFMYINTIVKRFVMNNFKRDLIPMRHRIKISKEDSPNIVEERPNIDRIPYVSMLGFIMYPISVTCRFQADLG